MRGRKAAKRAQQVIGSLLVSVTLVTLLLVLSGGVAEASWSHIEGRSEILAASSSPFGTFIKQAVGQTVSLLMMAVAIIIAVPLLIAGLAFSVSYVLSRASRRWEKQPKPIRDKLSVGALPRTS